MTYLQDNFSVNIYHNPQPYAQAYPQKILTCEGGCRLVQRWPSSRTVDGSREYRLVRASGGREWCRKDSRRL